MPDWVVGLLSAVMAVVIGVISGIIGWKLRRSQAEKTIGSAELQAKKIVEDGIKAAENEKKAILLAAKEDAIREKAVVDKEIKERRAEISRQESRILAKEENVDRRIANLDKKEETLNEKIRKAEALNAEIEQLKSQEVTVLEKLSGYSSDAAKEELVSRIEDEARRDAAAKILKIEEQLKEQADEKAKNIISLSIQRLAAEHVSEATISAVTLPNDEMKGRIIGREGRNINKIEALTGVDLIIDDTPEMITVSCFDPVRREVARLTLEKLITDGRIHPTRIEETVEKAQREVAAVIKQAGERATFEAGIHGLNPDLEKLLGRLHFRTSYGQNVLNHSLEVAYLAGMMADELGVDSNMARRAGLLHDIGKALTQEVEGSHVQIGVDIAKKYKQNPVIINAIEAHHGDVEAKSVIAVLVQAADAISAARPGARREDLENYIKRLQKLEEIANSFKGIDKSYAIQAGREIRIMVKPEEVNDDQMVIVARDIVKKIEDELEYPGQIKIHVIRESRAVDFAK